ncbi:MAG: F0F1 ATP synthase subunit B [Acidimicrobiales bacterium]
MLIASSNFLVPNGTLFVEIVAFLVVLFVIGRYVLPVLNKTLEERQEQIRSALEAADAARAEADETRAQRNVVLDEARQQAREIVAQANANAERVRADATGRGQQEYERLVSSAEAEIALARQRAVDEVTGKVAGLVLSVAQQVIGREINAESHRALIEEAVSALRGSADTSAAGTQG